jgi:hypothetical protein
MSKHIEILLLYVPILGDKSIICTSVFFLEGFILYLRSVFVAVNVLGRFWGLEQHQCMFSWHGLGRYT